MPHIFQEKEREAITAALTSLRADALALHIKAKKFHFFAMIDPSSR
jgi:hypothetical protein